MAVSNVEDVPTIPRLKEWKEEMREKTLYLLNARRITDEKFSLSIRPSLHFQHLAVKVPYLLPRARASTAPS